jgi:uncharacterized protein (DUF362 family)
VGSLAGALAASGLPAAQVSSKASASKLGIPGLFPARVVAVENAASIVSGGYQADAVRAMMRKGMGELCGGDWADAWRALFQPGDVVGIKVNPVGAPHVISDATVVREIVAGLTEAGIKPRDIVLYDRYADQFANAGFGKWAPDGVRTASAVPTYDPVQLAIEGYDPDHYMEMALVLPGQDAGSVTARRSFAARFITQQVNKVINLPVLKDHQSAGVTLALKNLSHGFVNNVSRSHSTKSLNACGSFIPAVVAMPVIRQKVVLNILDGIKGLYHGGPGAPPQFVWEHKTMYFATDPVALDHIGWEAIDRKRTEMKMKILVEDKPDQFSTFVHRQPEHVEIAGALGLGEFDLSKIKFRKV